VVAKAAEQPAKKAVKRPALAEAVRAYLAKNPAKRPGKRPAKRPADPLAEHKIKVERHLKKRGLTFADLYSAFPDFWEYEYEIRSYKLGVICGPIDREKLADERLKRKLERRIAEGYPRDYYERPDIEQRRIAGAVRSRRWRAKLAPKKVARPVRDIPAATITTRDWGRNKLAQLKAWTGGTGSSALRGRETELVKVAARYQALSDKLGRQPSHGELANALGCNRRAARNRAAILVRLYSAGGPWHSKA